VGSVWKAQATVAAVCAGLLLTPSSSAVTAGKAAAAAPAHVTVASRRITESQYRNAIADIFGRDIKLNGRFEPGKREGGLLAIGNSELSITSGGFEQYFALARSVADQALDPKRRDAIVPCKPADPKAADAGCAAAFVQKYGALLFRRPLTAADVAGRVAVANRGATQAGDFYEGLKLSLVSLLMAPEYLFRIEQAEADPTQPGQMRLDGYTKAARISYLLWDSGPDAELLAAAAKGELHTQAGLDREIARMLASPRLESGVRAFFTDMLQLDQLEGLQKDSAAYPKFSQALVDSAREQTLRSLVDHLVGHDGDYRDIFTARTTTLNRHLASVYNAPFLGGGGEWASYTFPDDAERAGVLTEVSFLSMFSHPAASSPTRRGVKVNEIFKCRPTPDPPPDVDFSKVQATDHGTVRSRLIDHMTNPGCSACHKASDPVGLTLEHFDSIGQKRLLENGAPIDVSGELGGKAFAGAPGLGKLMHDDPKVASCLVQQVYAYGVGRQPRDADEDYLAAQSRGFAADAYRLKALFARIGGSPEFFKVMMPEKAPVAPPGQKVASAAPQRSKGAIQ